MRTLDEEYVTKYFISHDIRKWWKPEQKRSEKQTFVNQHQQILEAIAEITKESPTTTLLDLGCGNGRITIPIADLFPNLLITAVDMNPYMTSDLLSKGRTNISVRKSNIINFLESLPKNTKYDIALCIEVLVHIPNIERTITLMSNHCKTLFTTITTERFYENRSPSRMHRGINTLEYEAMLRHHFFYTEIRPLDTNEYHILYISRDPKP